MLAKFIQIIGIGLGIALMALAPLAFAHDAGHGRKIEGLGPSGGKLAPVILARDAELGERAPTTAVAEWKRTGDQLEIQFWDVARKQVLRVPAKAELKWIFLGKKLAKPVVLKREAGPKSGAAVNQDGSAPGSKRVEWQLVESFEAGLLGSTETVEIILPALGPKAEKLVVALTF